MIVKNVAPADSDIRKWLRANAMMLLGLIALAIVTFVWFGSLPAGMIMGDDLRLVYGAQHGAGASSPLEAVTHPDTGIYRPLLMLLFSLIIPIFGTNFALYQDLNTVVEIMCAGVVSLIAFRVSRENTLVALGAAAAFIFSRFAYYAIGQLFGLMEGLTLLLTLLVVLECESAYRLGSYRPLVRGTIWFGLSLLVAERYIAVLPFILLAVAIFPGRILDSRRWLIGAMPLLFVALDFILNTTVMHTRFFQADGTSLSFHPSVLLQFVASGLLNIFGFNSGPAYLSAKDIADVGSWGYPLAVVVCVPFLLAAGAIAARIVRGKDRLNVLRNVFLWLALFTPLLLSACVSFRQEFRWLYGPDAIAILGLAAVAGLPSKKNLLVVFASIWFVVGTIVSTVFYRQFVTNIYFFNAEQTAEQVATIAKTHSGHPLVVATNGDTSVSDWVFMGDEFFDEFKLGVDHVYYVTSASDEVMLAKSKHLLAPTIIDIHGASVVDLAAASLQGETPFGATVFSFTSGYDRGSINSLAPASTPNGRGAFLTSWPSTGGPIPSLTVLATYKYLFRNVTVEPAEAIVFRVADPYPIGVGVRAFVDVLLDGKKYRMYDELLSPAPASGPRWEQQNIDLRNFSGKSVSIVFGADVRENNPTAAWGAFGSPALVRTTR